MWWLIYPSFFVWVSVSWRVFWKFRVCERRCFWYLDVVARAGEWARIRPIVWWIQCVKVHNRPFMAALTARDSRFSVLQCRGHCSQCKVQIYRRFFFCTKNFRSFNHGKLVTWWQLNFFQRHNLFGLKSAEFSEFKFLKIFWAFLKWASYLNRPFRESSHVGRGWQWVVLCWVWVVSVRGVKWVMTLESPFSTGYILFKTKGNNIFSCSSFIGCLWKNIWHKRWQYQARHIQQFEIYTNLRLNMYTISIVRLI